MPCRTFRDENGKPIAIVCTRGGRKCQVAGCSNRATQQCDYPVERNGKVGTCDLWLCRRCAVPQPGDDLDYCPPHHRMNERQQQ
jgi:hypothetical protein